MVRPFATVNRIIRDIPFNEEWQLQRMFQCIFNRVLTDKIDLDIETTTRHPRCVDTYSDIILQLRLNTRLPVGALTQAEPHITFSRVLLSVVQNEFEQMVGRQDKLLEKDLMREVVIPADHIEGSLLVVIFGGKAEGVCPPSGKTRGDSFMALSPLICR